MSKNKLLSDKEKIEDLISQFNTLKQEIEDELNQISSINYKIYKEEREKDDKIYSSILKIIALKRKIQQGLYKFTVNLDEITKADELPETEVVYSDYEQLSSKLVELQSSLEVEASYHKARNITKYNDCSYLIKQQQTETQRSLKNINMQILGGFIGVLGLTTVAVAFVVFNASTFGIPGLIVAGIGVTTALLGLGLFKLGSYKNGQKNSDENQLVYPADNLATEIMI
ncbi:hypothetical protein [Legionella gresilensis]|uniref:hypothetical protein n=1 Tax=Legionella gresilensis TaxID=91823 RepID=UPI001041BBF7|nr:hypothetical protein [Legionella gresilensis]